MGDGPPLVPGHTLLRPLGPGGGSGTVYLARSSAGDEETVEVTDAAVRPAVVALALAAREQAAQQRVSGEHVLRVHDVLPLADGAVAVVRDAAAAGSLEQLVTRRGRLTPGEVTTLLTPLARTLAELDASGVVHGALRPAAVLLTQAGKPVLTGFDAVRLVGEHHRHPRSGTTAYDAPEVSAGAVPGPACDAWSLGAIGWYALTGDPPPPGAGDRAGELLGPPFAAALAPLLEPDPVRRAGAGVAARAVHGAAPPVPLDLQLPGPESTLGPPAGPVGHPGERDPAIHREVAVAEAPPPCGSSPGEPVSARPRRAGAARPGRGGLPPRWRAVVVGVCLVAFVSAFLLLLSRGTAGGVAGAPGPATGGTRAVPVRGADPLAQAGATPAEILQGLVDARAAAVTARAPLLLDRAELPSSAPYRADAALIGRLAASAQTFEGLRFVVHDATVVVRDPARMEVSAVVAREPHVLLDARGGGRASQPASAGVEYRYRLARTASGWRLADLVAPPTATPGRPAPGPPP